MLPHTTHYISEELYQSFVLDMHTVNDPLSAGKQARFLFDMMSKVTVLVVDHSAVIGEVILEALRP